MKVLELFAGTRSIGKAFEQAGHEVYSVERGGKLPVELDETYTDKRTIEQHIKDGTLRPDDVHVKGGVKIFEREL